MPATNTSTAARRYATAFLETAESRQSIDSIEQDMADMAAMLSASDDLRAFIKSPVISHDERQAVIRDLASKAKLHELTQNLLLLLAENGRLFMLSGVIAAVHGGLAKMRGEIKADVQSASALSADQTKALQEAIGKALGSNVALNVSVNKDLIGGMVVQVGSMLVDASVKNKIERLARAMSAGKTKAA